MSGEKLFEELCNLIHSANRPADRTNAIWGQYFNDEQAWKGTSFDERRKILREYTSRVWNAGRAIERPPAY